MSNALDDYAKLIYCTSKASPATHEPKDIELCKDIVTKLRKSNKQSDKDIATAKISKILERCQIDHTEDDLIQIANKIILLP